MPRPANPQQDDGSRRSAAARIAAGSPGLGVLGMPLMALTIPPVQAAAITLPILIVQDAFSVWVYRRAWDRTNLEDPAAGRHCGISPPICSPPGCPTRQWRWCWARSPSCSRCAASLTPPRRRAPGAARPTRPAGWFWARSRASPADRPRRRAAVPDLCDPAAAAARPLRRHRRRVLRAVNLIKVPPYLALGQFRARTADLGGPVPAGDRLDLGRRLAGAPGVAASASTISCTSCCCCWAGQAAYGTGRAGCWAEERAPALTGYGQVAAVEPMVARARIGRCA